MDSFESRGQSETDAETDIRLRLLHCIPDKPDKPDCRVALSDFCFTNYYGVCLYLGRCNVVV